MGLFYLRIFILLQFRFNDIVLYFNRGSAMLNFIVDFTCGTISGIANCCSGYILDTLKVRMQMNPNLTMSQTFRIIVKEEGFVKLFNGIYYPLLTIPMVNAVMFSSYELYKVIRNKTQMSLLDGFQNGAFAGLIVTAVVAPVQLIKCIMQNDKQAKFSNSKQCLRSILKNQGVLGLFRGSFSTAARQIPSYSIQFATYQYLKLKYITDDHPHLDLSEALIVGPVSAFNSWIVSYPQDVIKTKIQIQESNKYKQHRWFPDGGFIQCGKQIYKTMGYKGFLYGIVPCLLRAALADGIGIVVYEKCQQRFANLKQN